MKIFVNAYLENNLGDDLFFEILQNRYPNQEYYLLSSSYKTTNKNVHIISNEIIIKAIRKLQMKQIIANKCDINVVIGGSMYMETQNKIPKFSLGKNPYYILGANFGPYKTKEYFNAAHKFLQMHKMYALEKVIHMSYLKT
jgi:colanic acid/amylovoran biosynthesis protein